MRKNLHLYQELPHALKRLSMCVLMLCLSVGYAMADNVIDGGVKFKTSSDGTASVIGYTSDLPANVTIPPSISYGGTTYTVTSIGYAAFWSCGGLISVNIPDGVTSIGDGAFSGCSSLTSINIPAEVTSIGVQVFAACSSLTSINIPSGVTSIGEGAFVSCSSLTSIIIPDGVTLIESSAFRGCSSLTSVSIPQSVVSIMSTTFANCSSLTAIDVDTNNTKYCSLEGVLYNKNRTVLYTCPAGKSGAVYIPESVTLIESFAFKGCSSLTSINIPAGVTSIGNSAFYGCFALNEIKVSNPIPPEIESGTFANVDKTSCQLIVPQGSLKAYRNADYWKEFLNIIEDTASGIDDVASDNAGLDYQVVNGNVKIVGTANQPVEIYSIDGVLRHRATAENGEISFSPGQSGMYIIRCGQNTAKVMVK